MNVPNVHNFMQQFRSQCIDRINASWNGFTLLCKLHVSIFYRGFLSIKYMYLFTKLNYILLTLFNPFISKLYTHFIHKVIHTIEKVYNVPLVLMCKSNGMRTAENTDMASCQITK